ncbi:unnamed protein product [Choristocarpus tenellus]
MSSRPIRADHGISRKKSSPHTVGSNAAAEGDERSKQQRRVGPAGRRGSPEYSRTPSPKHSLPHSPAPPPVQVASHGHGHNHGARRSPSSKSGVTMSGSRISLQEPCTTWDKRRSSPDHVLRKSAHTHPHGTQRNLGSKSPGLGNSLYKGQQPKGGVAGRGSSSPTSVAGQGGTKVAGSPPSGTKDGVDACDALFPPVLTFPGPSAMEDDMDGFLAPDGGEVREMTQLDRVFLEQTLSHQGRPNVEDDDLPLCKEIQTHLQPRVQNQLLEATYRSSSINSGRVKGGLQTYANPGEGCDMELIQDSSDYKSPVGVGQVSTTSRAAAVAVAAASAVACPGGIDPVPVRAEISPPGLSDVEGEPTGFFHSVERGAGMMLDAAATNSPVGITLQPVAASLCEGEESSGSDSVCGASGGDGSTCGEGEVRAMVGSFDSMELDKIDMAVAILQQRKQQLLAGGGGVSKVGHHRASSGGSIRGNGSGLGGFGGSRHHRRGGSRAKYVSEASSEGGAAGRTEAFVAAAAAAAAAAAVAGVNVAGGSTNGAGMRGTSNIGNVRAPRVQGRPPAGPGHLAPGHLSAAAMRRSSPGSIASLAELDRHLEHHHRRLVEQVAGRDQGGGDHDDDVEAEIRSDQARRARRQHRGDGGGGGSSGRVSRTAGAHVSDAKMFTSALHGGGGGWWWDEESTSSSQRFGGDCGTRIEPDFMDLDQAQQVRRWEIDHPEEAQQPTRFGQSGGGGTWRHHHHHHERSGFVGVIGSNHSQTSSPKSMMSSSDVSCASWGHPVMVSPGSPNNISFADRPPPSFVPRVRLEAVRSPRVVGGGSGPGGVGLDEKLFTSPDASKHVEQLHSPRSAFTPRSSSSMSTRSTPPRRR